MKMLKSIEDARVALRQLALGLAVSAAVVFGPGLAAHAQLPVTNGLALWLDASRLTGLADGQQVDSWTDMSGQTNHALRQSGSSSGYPQYKTSQINGAPVVRFNSGNNNPGDYFKFNRISTIRTVFWVVKENAGLSDGHFLLGDDTEYHFHRGSANGPIWDSGWPSVNIRNGTTKLMGTNVNGTTTSIPASQFQVISLVTVGNVQANQVTQDRVYHGSWQGDIAEILIYTNALSAANEALVGSYLSAKYGLSTAYPPVTPSAPTGLGVTPSATAIGLNWTAAFGAAGYNVRRSAVSGTNYVKIGTASGTSYTDGTVVTGTTYYYVVSATNSTGESTNSLEVSATAAAGTVRTWSGGGTNGYWTLADNWGGGAPPMAGDSLVFAGATRLSNTNDYPLNTGFQGLSFAAGSGAFILNGNGLVLSGDVVDSATVTQKVNVCVGLGSAGRVFSVVTNGQLLVSQPISGSQGITKDGPGTLTLTVGSSYSGDTLVSGGKVRLAPSASASDMLPTSTTVNLTTNGATLDLNGVSQTLASLSGVAGSSVMLGAGTLTVGGNNASTTFAGIISGSGAVVKEGNGTVTLGGANSFSGNTLINHGCLKVASSGSLAGSSSIVVASGALLDVSEAPAFTIAGGHRLTGGASVTGLVALADSAVLAPGNTRGTFTLQSGLTLRSNSVIELEVDTAADLLRISGGVFSAATNGTTRIDALGTGSVGSFPITDWTGATPSGVGTNAFVLGAVPAGYIGSLQVVSNSLRLTLVPGSPQAITTNTIATLRLALNDLAQRYAADYGAKAPGYIIRLAAIETSYRAALAAGNQAGIQAAESAYQVLKREALVINNPALSFNRLMFVRRTASTGLPQNWQNITSIGDTACNDALAVLDVTNLTVSAFYTPAMSQFLGYPNLHWNGDRLLFTGQALTNGARPYTVFEIKSNGTGLKQVSPAAGSDIGWFDACYLPCGDMLMVSTATFAGVPCVGGGDYVGNLYRVGTNGVVRQLTFDQDQNWGPTILSDGRVMFTRWEYSDTPHYFSRILFTMMPDGLEQFARYGSGSYFPNSLFDAKPVPGKPSQFVGVISGHHGVAREGELLLFDEAVGTFEADGVLHRFCGPNPVLPEVRDAYIDERNPWPRFVQPSPLDEKQLIVSAKPNSSSTFGLCLVDQFDNLCTLYSEAANSLMHPTPFKVVAMPPVIPDRVKIGTTNGIVNISDLHFGPGLRDVPRGKIKNLRVYSVHYGYRNQGGHINIGVDGPWDVHRIMGTVPVYEDGSASFYAPANTPISVQPLDEEGKALQLFRSWYTVMPGESVSCAGCHEQRNLSMVNQASIASRKSPDNIIPWFGPERGFSFLREVQPVLDQYCAGCHGGTGGSTNVPPDLYTTNRVVFGNSFPQSYVNLHPYVRRTGNEGYMRLNNPGEWHADTSELIQILQKGHYGVALDTNAWSRLVTWIDLNVPAWGLWGEHSSDGNYANAHTRRLQIMKSYASVTNDPELYPIPAPARAAFVAPVPPLPITPVTPPANTLFNVAGAKTRRNAATNSTTPAELTLTIGTGITLVLDLIPTGSVLMGSATGYRDEALQTLVTNSRAFYLGKFEIMNKQYALFDPTHQSGFVPQIGKDHGSAGWDCNGTDQPVIRVSWAEAMKYCEWLTRKTGRKFTLPTESQWEYACRAGTATDMWYGATTVPFNSSTQLIAGDSFYRSGMLANLAGAEYYGAAGSTPSWHLCNTSLSDSWAATGNVDPFASNPFGLCAMHGNAAEWTRSTYAPYPYSDTDGRNRAVYATNEWLSLKKVVRGGSCVDREKLATASVRTAMYAWQRGYNVGFRVVANISTTNSGIPTASLAASPTNGTAPLTVSFNGAASRDNDGTLLKYDWSFGDGTSASGTNTAMHTYAVPGTYVAALTVTDDDAFTATATNLITVRARTNNALAPLALFTTSPATGAAPCRVTFDGTASSAPGGVLTAWYWDFGDGLAGNGTVAAHTYKQAGRYPVSLTVIANSGARASRTGTVTVTGAGGNQAPLVEAGPAAFATVGTNITLGGFVSDDGLPNPPGNFTATWSKVKGQGTVAFGDAHATNTTAVFSTNGVYVLQLAAYDGELTSSDTVTITVSAQGVYHSPQEVAWSPDGSLLAVADVTAHALVLVNPVSAQVVRSVALAGEPRDLLWNGTNSLFVSEHDAGTVAEVNSLTGIILRRLAVGPKPSGLARVPGKNLLLVADRGLSRLQLLDLASGEVRVQVSVIRDPVYVTVTPDQQFALVANHLPLGDGRDPLLGAALSLVNLNDPREVNSIQLPAGASSVQRPVCSPDGRWAYVPYLLGRSHLPTTQLSRGWVTTSALGIIDLQNKLIYATALFDQSVDGAANPYGATLSADGCNLWATLAGVRELGKLDLRSLQTLIATNAAVRTNLSYDLSTLYRSNLLQRIPLPAEGPRGIALAPNQSRLAIAAYFGSQVLLTDTNGLVTSQIALGAQPADDSVRRGDRLFHDANGCYQRWVSCITCHPGTRADGMNWDMMNDGFGNSKNTKSLLYAPRTEPAMWTGIRANAMVGIQAGFKFIEFQAHPQQDYDDIYSFLMSLEPEPSPYWVNGKLTPDAVQGKALFESAEAKCLTCHLANYYYAHTNKYDVGTRHAFDWTQNDITGYVPPPLFELWRSAPYLHDGSAVTMREVLTTFNAGDEHGKTSHLSANQLDQLAAYLLQIGGYLPSTGTNSYRLDVVQGSGAGQYLPGSTVTVAASANPPGLTFNSWTGQPVLEPAAPTTTLFMPDADAAVTALFQDLPGLPDSDGDGLPDSWTWLYFGHATGQAFDLSRAQDDADGDGQSNYAEYIAGTDPKDSNDYFRVSIFGNSNASVVGFSALPTAGYGYTGLGRFYGLDQTTNLPAVSWAGVPGLTNTPGLGQFVTLTNAVPTSRQFFRSRVWLAPAAP